MKKLVLSVVIALSTIFGLNAQNQSKGTFGARIAWDLTSPSSNLEEMNNGSGFSIGAIYNLPLSRSWYFEPGLSFFYNTMGVTHQFVGASSSSFEESITFTSTLRNSGFRVPFTFGYCVELVDNIAVSVFTGPQLNFNLSMKEHCPHRNPGKWYGDNFDRFDAQWLFGIRMHYQDNFFAEIGGGIGMTNLLDTDSEYLKNKHLRRNSFSISVGYMF